MFDAIRHKLFAALAGFTVLLCLCYTGLALVIAYVTEDMLIDRLLQREAATIRAHFQVRGDVAAPDDSLVRIYRSASALPPAARTRVAAGEDRAEIGTSTGQHYHLRTLVLGTQPVYLLADVRPLLVVTALFREVGGFLAAVATGMTALALLLAWLLSRRLVAPLQVLAHEVRSLGPDSPVAFSARDRRDEIGYLADKLATTIAALQAALRREHAFTRDVGHELRTPLTVIKNSLAQGADVPLSANDLAQLRASADEIGTTIDVLFALARAAHIADETVDLRACMEECLLRLLDDGAWNTDRLVLDVPDRLPVVGNRHLCMLLLNNCLGNALFHGGAGTRLLLSFADGMLTIGNSVDPARPGTVQGFQHGQHLLRRLAATLRWEMHFHAGAGSYRVEIVPRLPD